MILLTKKELFEVSEHLRNLIETQRKLLHLVGYMNPEWEETKAFADALLSNQNSASDMLDITTKIKDKAGWNTGGST